MTKQQKMCHFTTLIGLAFLFVCFYVLGGGRESVSAEPESSGLNTSLPEARQAEIESQKQMAVSRIKQQQDRQENPGYSRHRSTQRFNLRVQRQVLLLRLRCECIGRILI